MIDNRVTGNMPRKSGYHTYSRVHYEWKPHARVDRFCMTMSAGRLHNRQNDTCLSCSVDAYSFCAAHDDPYFFLKKCITELSSSSPRCQGDFLFLPTQNTRDRFSRTTVGTPWTVVRLLLYVPSLLIS